MAGKDETSALQELNKLIAEKEAIVFEQDAMIKQYESILQRLKADKTLSDAKIKAAETEVKYLEHIIEQEAAHNKQMVECFEIVEQRNQETEAKITQAEEEMETLWNEQSIKTKQNHDRLNLIQDGIFADNPKYAEYKVVQKANEVLASEVMELKKNYTEQKANLSHMRTAQTEERNKKIIEFAESALKLKRLHDLQTKYKQVDVEYIRATEKLMQSLENVSCSPVEKEVPIPEISAVDEAELNRLISQQQLNAYQKSEITQEIINSPETSEFKVPAIPINPPSTTQFTPKSTMPMETTSTQKVDILQNIEISNYSIESPYFVKNKRKGGNNSKQREGGLEKKHKSVNFDDAPFGAAGDLQFNNMDTFAFGEPIEANDRTKPLGYEAFSGFDAKSPNSEEGNAEFYMDFKW